MKTAERVTAGARAKLLERFSVRPEVAVDEILDRGFMERDSELLADMFGATTEQQIRSDALAQLRGNGIFQPLLDDETIEEIWINRPDEIFYVRSGVTHRDDCELSSEQIRTLCLNLLRDSGRRVDRVSPFADASLSDGSRLHIVIPDITRNHWAINIRKFGNRQLFMDDLLATETLTLTQAEQLRAAAVSGKNILISGATHSGKTTLLSALLAELPSNTRLVTCEETFEIKSPLVDWVAMQTRQANLEGGGEVALRRLVKEALRMRPERLVIGEVREAESFDLLIAMNSGIPGLCTIHANSASNALTKLRTLPMLAGPNISGEFVSALIAECIDLVVHLENRDGYRRVAEILTVKQAANS